MISTIYVVAALATQLLVLFMLSSGASSKTITVNTRLGFFSIAAGALWPLTVLVFLLMLAIGGCLHLYDKIQDYRMNRKGMALYRETRDYSPLPSITKRKKTRKISSIPLHKVASWKSKGTRTLFTEEMLHDRVNTPILSIAKKR